MIGIRKTVASGRAVGIALVVLMLLAIALPGQVVAQGATLQSVDVSSLPGNQVRLGFRVDGSLANYDSFTISDPARIVVDLPNVRNGVSQRFRRIGVGLLESLTVSEAQERTRATVKLSRMVAYDLEQQGDTLYLTLEAGGNTAGASASATSTQTASDASVDFRRGTEGQGVLSLTLPLPSVSVDVRQEGNRIVADMGGMQLTPEQERRLDVIDFATPVKSVDVFNHSGGARIVVDTLGPFEYLAYQAGNEYTLEVKPVQPEQVAEAAETRKRQFGGEPLSLNFQDIEVRAVLQILADFTGLNVVVSDSVGGNLTLRLKNVPWDQAMDIILKTKGLSMRENGNVVLIAPTEEIAAREKLELEAQKQTAELEPLRSEMMQINYAKASEVGALLKSSEASMLSERGNITVDARTNTILVQDITSKITQIRNLIVTLDVPVRQVMIDSRVVIASDDFTKELGVRFGGALRVTEGDHNRGGLSGTLPAAVTTALSDQPLSASPLALGIDNRIGVNLPTTNTPFGRLGLGILGADFLLDLELSALQAEGRGEVLSNPRVVTTNRKQARIEQGTEIPYLEQSSSGATSISFKKAVLSLDVTPQITPNNNIIMDLTVNKDAVGELVPSGIAGGFVPSIDTRAVETQVLVENGETVVLGGIYERSQITSVDKVPLLGDLPGIGRLFRRNLDQDEKAELLIFVTPRIVQESALLQ
jgi:type IV pilus assembly protein PilQ